MGKRGPNLTEEERKVVRMMYHDQGEEIPEIANFFNRDQSCIHKVLFRKKKKQDLSAGVQARPPFGSKSAPGVCRGTEGLARPDTSNGLPRRQPACRPGCQAATQVGDPANEPPGRAARQPGRPAARPPRRRQPSDAFPRQLGRKGIRLARAGQGTLGQGPNLIGTGNLPSPAQTPGRAASQPRQPGQPGQPARS